MLEIAASLHLLPGIWRDIHWRSLIPLILGCLIATPFGVALLASVPPAPMQIALAIFVLVATALLWRGFAMKKMPGTAGAMAAGAVGGFCNGAFGIAGPPVILFYFSSPAGHKMGRASLIAFFLATDLIGLPLLAREGLVTEDAFYRALIFLIPLIAGVWIGARSFKTADPAQISQNDPGPACCPGDPHRRQGLSIHSCNEKPGGSLRRVWQFGCASGTTPPPAEPRLPWPAPRGSAYRACRQPA